MKSILTLGFLSFFINFATSQIILNSEMMPKSGDTIHYRQVNNFSGDVDLTGADFFWDMSNSIGNQWIADTFVTVTSTPLAYNATFNNPLAPKYRASCASPQPNINIPFGGMDFKNIYNYYKLAADTVFSQVGTAITVNNVPIAIRFDDIDHMYNFPFEYSGFDSCYSSYSVTIPTFGHNSRRQTRLNYFDGYGTLITPIDTFHDAIRIKTIIKTRDSIYSEQYNVPIAFNTTTTEYKWFAEDYRGPVAQITKTSGQGPARTTFKYRETPPPVSTFVQNNNTQIGTIQPNPFNNKLTVILNNQIDYEIQLISISGQVLWHGKTSQQNIFEFPSDALSSLNIGLYFLRIMNDTEMGVFKVVKE
jgi:hypothetical protein